MLLRLMVYWRVSKIWKDYIYAHIYRNFWSVKYMLWNMYFNVYICLFLTAFKKGIAWFMKFENFTILCCFKNYKLSMRSLHNPVGAFWMTMYTRKCITNEINFVHSDNFQFGQWKCWFIKRGFTLTFRG